MEQISAPVQMVSHTSVLLLVEWYYTPTLVWLGTLGNCLAVYVLLRAQQLRKISSSHYLAALAASDTVQLQCTFLVWVDVLGIDVFNRRIGCELLQYFIAVTSFLSIWFVLAFTAKRFVAVKYPLRSKYLCTVTNARVIIATLIFIALVIYSPLLLFLEAKEREMYFNKTEGNKTLTVCSISTDWLTAYNYFNMADTVIACQIPVVAIVTLNVIICKQVFWSSSVRKRLVGHFHNGDVPTEADSHIAKMPTKEAINVGSSYKLTKMLLIVSTVSLMLSLPSYVMRVLMFKLNVDGDELFIELQHWTTVLYNTNFGINFLLYCVSGQNFRNAAKTVLCPHRKNKRAHSESRTHSTGSSDKKKMSPLQTTISTSF